MKVLSIGDLHFPFENKKLIKEIIKQIRIEKPNVIIQLGDLFDQYMYGRYDKNLSVIQPDSELEKAKAKAIKFWNDVKKASPRSKKIQLLGNHDVRMLVQTLKKFPEVYHVMQEAHENLYDFKGVEVKKSDKDFVKYFDTVYCHGWAATHMAHFRSNVIRAHDHKAWMKVVPASNKIEGGGLKFLESYKLVKNDNFSFEISAGMFGDESQLPFGYVNSRRTNWRPAIVIETEEYVELRILG